MSNNTFNYASIWDECVPELNPDTRQELFQVVSKTKKVLNQHEKDYNNSHGSSVRMVIADAGVKELLVALMIKGYL